MKRFLLIILLVLFTGLAFSQERNVSGRIIDKADGGPVPGASVSNLETGATTSADSKGTFSIQAASGQSLKISFIGMKTDTILVGTDTDNLVIRLEGTVNTLNQVVVTGYQTQKKADLTGAVSVVNVAEIRDIPSGNPIKSIQGRVPGVFITSSGSPDAAATVRIRGIGTLGNNDPLYIIDGIPTTRGLQELNQNDIESIQVLKDASAATIYGSRAANGVIIVTTKKAKKGFSRIDVNSSVSTQYYNTRLKILNTNQRGEAYWQAAVNDGADPNNNQIYQYDWTNTNGTPVLNQVILPEYIDVQKTMQPANTNWFNEIAQTSILQLHNLTFSNGGEKGNALVSLSYYDNNGIVKGSNSNKITARVNSDYNFFKGRLKAGENLSATYTKNVLIPAGDVLFAALVQQPVVPVHTIDGGWGGPAPGMTDRQNPVRLIEDNKQNKSYFGRLFGNVYLDFEIIPNLHLKSTYGVDYDGTYARTLRKSYTSGFLSDPSNLVSTSQGYDGNRIWQNTLTYNLNVNKNRFDFLLGHEQIKYISQSFFGNRQGYALENIDYAYLDAGSSNKDNGGSGSGNSLLSYFGKVNYTYNDKYLASVTVRRDGSSRFGKENQFGVFPAFSLGWRLSQEAFFKNALPFVSDFKLRYGWGKTGNQEIANNATYSLYSAIYGTDPTWGIDQGSAYDINGAGTGQLPSGYTLIQQGNESLKWESTTQSNYGIDYGFLENRFTGSIDYFIKNTSDILISPPYLGVLGQGGNRWLNGASMENKGFEFLLSYDDKIGRDLSLSITGNIATYRNKITYLPSDVLTGYPGNGQDKTILGRSVNSFFGYVADGLFKSQDEVDNSPEQVGKGLGRIRYKDLNGDNIVNEQDQDYIGTGDPNFTYGLNFGLNYKRFDLSFFFQGVQGIDVYNTYKIYTDFSSIWPGTNWGSRTMDAWTPQNPDSTIPALTLVDNNNEGRSSTYFIESGSYLKLRNLQIGYDLNGIKKFKVQRARIFVQGSNLLTLKSKSFTATDPENPNNAYPIPVVFTAGIDLSL